MGVLVLGEGYTSANVHEPVNWDMIAANADRYNPKRVANHRMNTNRLSTRVKEK